MILFCFCSLFLIYSMTGKCSFFPLSFIELMKEVGGFSTNRLQDTACVLYLRYFVLPLALWHCKNYSE